MSSTCARLDPTNPPPMPLTYALSPPPPQAAAGAPPLLLLLHGSGANEHDLMPLAPAFSGALGGAVVASLRGPHDQLGGYAWFHGNSAAPPRKALDSQIGASADALAAFIDAAPEALGTDPARAYVLGFSQGATIGWTLALSPWARSSLVAGMALLSGRCMPELLQPARPLGARPTAAGADALARRPAVLAAHGTADGVSPVAIAKENLELARQAPRRIASRCLPRRGSASLPRCAAQAGLRVEYMEHAGGHELPHSVLQWVAASLAAAPAAK